MKLLENERIVLRALEPEDLEVLFRWENDASLWELGSTFLLFRGMCLRSILPLLIRISIQMVSFGL